MPGHRDDLRIAQVGIPEPVGGQPAAHRACRLQRQKELAGQAEFFNDTPVPTALGGVEQLAGGGNRILAAQAAGQHPCQQVRHEEQFVPMGLPPAVGGHQLVHGVELHKRDAGAVVNGRIADEPIGQLRHAVGAVVPVVHRQIRQGVVRTYDAVIHAPGVDTDGRKRNTGGRKPGAQFPLQAQNIPIDVLMNLRRPVGKAVLFGKGQALPIKTAQYGAAGTGPQVEGKIVARRFHAPSRGWIAPCRAAAACSMAGTW